MRCCPTRSLPRTPFFTFVKITAKREFILSAMGFQPFAKKGGLTQIADSKTGPRSAFFPVRMFRIPFTDQSFQKVVSEKILAIYKKKNVFPLFKGQKFPIQELFRNLCCGDESQSKRAVDGQKQTSRPGQAARQDRQAGRWADCQARCTGEDSGPIMGAKSGTEKYYVSDFACGELKRPPFEPSLRTLGAGNRLHTHG